jgi:hypothetical protein
MSTSHGAVVCWKDRTNSCQRSQCQTASHTTDQAVGDSRRENESEQGKRGGGGKGGCGGHRVLALQHNVYIYAPARPQGEDAAWAGGEGCIGGRANSKSRR